MRGPVFFLGIIFATCTAMAASGAVKKYKDMTLDEQLALQRSEQRLALYDRSLIALDGALKHKKISLQEYSYEERDLNALIGAEAKYENDLMTKTSTFPEESREVMENIAKYAILVPAYIVGIAARGLAGSSFSFSP